MEFEEKEAQPTYNHNVHLVIDADSLIYRACHVGEKEYNKDIADLELVKDKPLFKEIITRTMAEYQQSILHSMIDGIIWTIREDLNRNGSDISTHTLLFTPKKHTCEKFGLKVNFRYEIIHDYNDTTDKELHHPDYKASRKGMPLPEGITEMFEYVESIEQASFSNHCEADDVAYWMKMNALEDTVIACLDKDIYMGTPSGDIGHYNYNKNEWIHTSEDEANLFFYRQCMTGDSSDGIKGIFRYGPKTAEKDLPEWLGYEETWAKVIDKFTEKGYTEEYAILMMRLVNLSQLTSFNEIELWTPPIVSEIVDGPGLRGTYDE